MFSSGNIMDITEEEINTSYKKLCEEEEERDKALQALLSRQSHLEAKVRNITKVLPNLEIIHSDSKQLAEMISYTSLLAENVSAKVRKLDAAQSRVTECSQRVEDLLDLELCSGGVDACLASEDYEKAAAHIHRFLAMDQRLLEKTADDMHQDWTSVSAWLRLLQEAAGRLRGIVEARLDEAVTRRDAASVERFFKLFPLLGLHDSGLDKFASFLNTKVEAVARKNQNAILSRSGSDKRAGVVYSDTLSLLFEEVARLFEVHQPLIETYYGPGRLMGVVERVQKKVDAECRAVLTELWRGRDLDRLSRLRQGQSRPDPKALDQLLIELTLIHSTYNLYTRFIHKKVMADLEVGVTDGKKREAMVEEFERRMKGWEVCVRMQELLGVYLTLEHYYMEESVRKAIAVDTVEPGSLISSMVDDVFFIVRKCIRRASSTGNIDGVCAVINNGCGVLESEMCSALMRSMRQGFPTGYLDLTQAYSVMIQGRLHGPSDADAAKTTFIAHLNNTEVGMEYVGTLVSGLVDEVGWRSEAERSKLEGCLSGLSSVSAGMSAAQELGLHQLQDSAVKPRIAPWLDSFLTVSHILSEEEFSSYEANEPFIRNLIANLDGLLSEFKAALTPGNYDSLVAIVATEVNTQMEKVILKTEFNRLGGVALDREMRALVSYLSKATSWSVRDKLARLTQAATLLSLDKLSELSDYSALPWRLTNTDIKRILKLRTDFRTDEIMRLKL